MDKCFNAIESACWLLASMVNGKQIFSSIICIDNTSLCINKTLAVNFSMNFPYSLINRYFPYSFYDDFPFLYESQCDLSKKTQFRNSFKRNFTWLFIIFDFSINKPKNNTEIKYLFYLIIFFLYSEFHINAYQTLLVVFPL